jgi:hypothetical protein
MRRQAWSLSDEHHHEQRLQQLANLVANGHATLFDQRKRSYSPTVQAGKQQIENWQRVTGGRQGRKTVGDDKCNIIAALDRAQANARILIEPTAKIGTRQVSSAIASGALQKERLKIALPQGFCDRLDRHRLMHCVSRPRMSKLKRQQSSGCERGTGAGQSDARGCRRTQRSPKRVNRFGWTHRCSRPPPPPSAAPKLVADARSLPNFARNDNLFWRDASAAGPVSRMRLAISGGLHALRRLGHWPLHS